MIKKVHKTEEELAVFCSYLIDQYDVQLTIIANDIRSIVVENGLCHHNMHDLIDSLKLKIAEKVILSLPSEIADWYTRSMLLEVIINEKDYEHGRIDGSVFGINHIVIDTDDNLTGETPDL